MKQAWSINSPLISVVVPVYNRRADLAQAVKSALLQTLPPHEIIIVDDASSDDSYDCALALTRSHPRQVRVLRHASNQGGSAARNTGWRQASGELIAFLDSDDRWYPHKLEKQVAAIQQDASFGLAFCGYVAVAGPNHRIAYVRRAAPTVPWERFRFELACGNAVGTTSVALVRKAVLEEAGGFDPAFPSCQDWELWYRLARLCRFVGVEETLVEYSHSSQGRISTSFERVTTGLQMMFEMVRKEYPNGLPRAIEARHYGLTGDIYRQFDRVWAAANCYLQAFRLHPSALPLRKATGLFAGSLLRRINSLRIV